MGARGKLNLEIWHAGEMSFLIFPSFFSWRFDPGLDRPQSVFLGGGNIDK